MLHGISWRIYLWVVLVGIIIFYVYLFLLYYKNEYKRFFKNLRAGKFRFPAGEEEGRNVHDIDFTHGLLQELNDFFVSGADRRYTKDELTTELRLKLQGTASVYNSDRRKEINAYISSECRKLCSIHLSEEDLRVLWEQ